ncbi:MAG: hypothetical protein P8N95_13900 [Paracoccaceae bacterium]|nr:hypothetical protein [Paracoccaceae bacterium]
MVDKNAHYLMNKDGVFYFTRHVPNDVRHLYERPRLVMCLKTKSETMALKASRSMASRLDDYWLQMRLTIYCLVLDIAFINGADILFVHE